MSHIRAHWRAQTVSELQMGCLFLMVDKMLKLLILQNRQIWFAELDIEFDELRLALHKSILTSLQLIDHNQPKLLKFEIKKNK